MDLSAGQEREPVRVGKVTAKMIIVSEKLEMKVKLRRIEMISGNWNWFN